MYENASCQIGDFLLSRSLLTFKVTTCSITELAISGEKSLNLVFDLIIHGQIALVQFVFDLIKDGQVQSCRLCLKNKNKKILNIKYI